MSFGGNYTLSLSDNGTTGVPLRLQHNADGSFFIRDDQAVFNELMKNQGLQRHIVKANFIWDLPDWRDDRRRKRIAAAIVNDWQLSGIFTGGSGAPVRHHLPVPEQRREREPDRLAGLRRPASSSTAIRAAAAADDRFSQFNTAAFSGPLPGSVGLESGRNYMVGCPDKTTDLAIARMFKLGGAPDGAAPRSRCSTRSTPSSTTRARRSCSWSARPTRRSGNPQFLADGTVDPNRLKTTAAGFGAVTGAQPLRTIQAQLRFSF